VTKALKILGIVVAAVLVLAVGAAVALTLLFDPNQYKPELVRLVKDKTGRDLKVEKKIGWAFFPRLGIEAGGLELSNAPGFGPEPFARIDAAGVHIALLPLLRGRLDIDSIYLHGLELQLARDAAGRSNWADLGAGGAPPAAEAGPEAKPPGAGKLPIEGLAIGALDVRRATVRWQDAQSGDHLVIRNLSLDTSRFAAKVPVDLRLGFQLERPKAPPIKAEIRSRLTVTPDSLKLANLDFKLDDSRLTGSLDVRHFAAPTVRFDLALDRIDLDRYRGHDHSPPPAALAAAPATAAPGPASTSAAPAAGPAHAGLRHLDIDGKFSVQELKLFGARATDARVEVHGKDGLITLGPTRARLYGGSYRGQPVVDARGQVLQLRLDEKLEQVQVGPLLKDLKLFDHYTGVGNIALDLNAQGADQRAITRTLNGRASIALHDGRIEGVDFVKLIEAARAAAQAAKGEAVTIPASTGDTTVFKSLTASARINNGVAHSEDIVLDGPNLRGTGRGKADLAREKLDYHLRLTLAESAERRGTTLPIRVAGTFAKPEFQADIGELLKMQVEKQLQRSLGKELGKELEKVLQPRKSRKEKLLEQQQQAPR
jgi:AsmA protein